MRIGVKLIDAAQKYRAALDAALKSDDDIPALEVAVSGETLKLLMRKAQAPVQREIEGLKEDIGDLEEALSNLLDRLETLELLGAGVDALEKADDLKTPPSVFAGGRDSGDSDAEPVSSDGMNPTRGAESTGGGG